MEDKSNVDIRKELDDIIRSNVINYINDTYNFTAIYLIMKSHFGDLTKAAINGAFESESKKLYTKIDKLDGVVPTDLDDVKQLIKDMKKDKVDELIKNLKEVII